MPYIRAAILLITALTLLASGGCKQAVAPMTIVQTVTQTVMVTPPPASSKAPTVTPKLNTVNISLKVVPPADYAAQSVPIYLHQGSVLHMNWRVEGGPFQIALTTPAGKTICVGIEGVVTSEEEAPALERMGEFRFSPGDKAYQGYDWGGDGYFHFVPNIDKDSPAVKITLSYWLEA